MATTPPQPEGWLYRKSSDSLSPPIGYFNDQQIVVEVNQGRLDESHDVWHAVHTQGDWRPASRIKAFYNRFAAGRSYLAQQRAARDARIEADKAAATRVLAESEEQRAHARELDTPLQAATKKSPPSMETDYAERRFMATRFLLFCGALAACVVVLGLLVKWSESIARRHEEFSKQERADSERAEVEETQEEAPPVKVEKVYPAELIPRDQCLPKIRAAVDIELRNRGNLFTGPDLKINEVVADNMQQAQEDLMRGVSSLLVHKSDEFRKFMRQNLTRHGKGVDADSAIKVLDSCGDVLFIPHAGDYRNCAEGDAMALTGPSSMVEKNSDGFGGRLRIDFGNRFYDWRLQSYPPSTDSNRQVYEWEPRLIPILVPLRDPIGDYPGEAIIAYPPWQLAKYCDALGVKRRCFFSLSVFQNDQRPLIELLNDLYTPDTMLDQNRLRFHKYTP